MTGTFKGSKILVTGVANDRSIAWGVAKALHEEGADVALTYPNEAIEKRVRPLAKEINCKLVLPCDVQSDEAIDRLFSTLEWEWGQLNGVLHSIAFANKEELDKRFHKISREGFKEALDVSAYSFIAMGARAQPLLRKSHGNLLTLTYLGAQRVVPNYSLMGVAKAALEAAVRYLAADLGRDHIRVNAISAGPLRTLAASGIPQFKELYAEFSQHAPLGRHVTQEEVAKTALFFLSRQSSGLTGEITYVDCGYNIMGI
jgi:enoyl-[acyl-carrier protein] reductase I